MKLKLQFIIAAFIALVVFFYLLGMGSLLTNEREVADSTNYNKPDLRARP